MTSFLCFKLKAQKRRFLTEMPSKKSPNKFLSRIGGVPTEPCVPSALYYWEKTALVRGHSANQEWFQWQTIRWTFCTNMHEAAGEALSKETGFKFKSIQTWKGREGITALKIIWNETLKFWVYKLNWFEFPGIGCNDWKGQYHTNLIFHLHGFYTLCIYLVVLNSILYSLLNTFPEGIKGSAGNFWKLLSNPPVLIQCGSTCSWLQYS